MMLFIFIPNPGLLIFYLRVTYFNFIPASLAASAA